MKLMIKQAQQTLRARGITLKRTPCNEFRVNYRDGRESTAYYTDHLNDALITGEDMASRRFYIYEGTEDSRDNTDRFGSLDEAKDRAVIAVQNARDLGLANYAANVIDSATGEFIFTESY